MTHINFDANASYGLIEEVREGIAEFSYDYANPSSIHTLGQNLKAVIEQSRSKIASLIDLTANQRIIFTSGASESNNHAIFSPFWSFINQGEASLVISTHEHPSVLEPAEELAKRGIKLIKSNPDKILDAIREDTKLVSIMSANNETGEIYPIQELAKTIRDNYPSVLIHTDAVQALGKTKFSAQDLPVDFISLSAHKIGALPGVGALVINRDLENSPFIFGGPQETRYRAGTENVLGIHSFGIAAAAAEQKLNTNISDMLNNKATIREALLSEVKGLIVNCDHQNSLPNTLSVQLDSVLADDLVVAADLEGLAISSGSACSSGKPLPSHVLMAMGKTEQEARSTIRLSVRADLSEEERDKGIEKLLKVLQKS